MTPKFINQNLIYKTYSGSISYGLNTPKSDVDIRGITIPPLKYYFGLDRFEQQEFDKDTVIWSLQKFIRLALDCNPNIIELLFVNKKDILFINKYGKLLRKNRNLFLTKRARYTFGGYAYSQLKRIKSHRKWIMNPQIKPNKKDYFKTKYMKLECGTKTVQYKKFLEHEYDLALKKYNQYINWKKNRNPERAKLENKYGYDCKHAMHLIRLLRMGCEILETGKVIVKRPDRKELLAIRNGKLSYNKLIKLAESYYDKLDKLYEISPLPKKPNYKKINKLLINITKGFFNESRNSKNI